MDFFMYLLFIICFTFLVNFLYDFIVKQYKKKKYKEKSDKE